MIYFAYCTLLDTEEMKKIHPLAKPAGLARLPGYKPRFSTFGDRSDGGCDLEQVDGEETLGLMYEMPPKPAKVDAPSESEPRDYKDIDVQVIAKDGRTVQAYTAVVVEPGGPFQPPEEYTRPILVGARALQLPPEYVSKLEKLIGGS